MPLVNFLLPTYFQFFSHNGHHGSLSHRGGGPLTVEDGGKRTHLATIQSRLPVPAQPQRIRCRCKLLGAGIKPADPSFKATDFYQQKLPRIVKRDGRDSNPRDGAESRCAWSMPLSYRPKSRVSGGNRTRLSSLEGWHLCRSAKGT